jgi:hypothetical protein
MDARILSTPGQHFGSQRKRMALKHCDQSFVPWASMVMILGKWNRRYRILIVVLSNVAFSWPDVASGMTREEEML